MLWRAYSAAARICARIFLPICMSRALAPSGNSYASFPGYDQWPVACVRPQEGFCARSQGAHNLPAAMTCMNTTATAKVMNVTAKVVNVTAKVVGACQCAVTQHRGPSQYTWQHSIDFFHLLHVAWHGPHSCACSSMPIPALKSTGSLSSATRCT